MASTTAIKSWVVGGTGGGSYIGFHDIDGRFVGGAKSLAEGEYSEMTRWYAVKQADITTPQRERQTQTGDDVYQGHLMFPSTDPVEIAIQIGVQQQARKADVLGIKEVDDDQLSYTLINPEIEDLPPACLLIHSPAKERVFGQRSRDGWVINMIHRCEISDRGSSISERTMRDYDFFATCDQTYVHPWGVAMTKDQEGAIGGAGIEAGDTYRIMLGAFRTDGTVSALDLTKRIRGDHTTNAMKVWSEVISTGVVTELEAGTDFEIVQGSGATLDQIVFGTEAAPVARGAGEHIVYRYQWS